MAEVKHISIDTSDEEALRIIEDDAAVIVDDVIQENEIDVAGQLCAAQASLKPLYDPTGERMKG